jgi:hypothetical protein
MADSMATQIGIGLVSRKSRAFWKKIPWRGSLTIAPFALPFLSTEKCPCHFDI